MKVTQMTSPRTGKPVANQFIVIDNFNNKYFQSYKSIIVKKVKMGESLGYRIELDRDTWNYSKTTSKYRNEFLGEDTKTTKAKIASGEYQLVNLN